MSSGRGNGAGCVSGSSQAERVAYCWAVTGLDHPFYGEHAEVEARAEAKRIGGTAQAFPLFAADLERRSAPTNVQCVHGTPTAPVRVSVAADEVLVAIRRGEGYEDVHPELVVCDAFGPSPFEWRLVGGLDIGDRVSQRLYVRLQR